MLLPEAVECGAIDVDRRAFERSAFGAQIDFARVDDAGGEAVLAEGAVE